MIRRLRWKIVAINMAMVTAVLLAVFVGVLVSSRAAVERTVNQRLMQVVQTGRYDASLPGEGSAAPCFVADVYPSGTVRLSGSSYYQLDDQDAMAEIVTACLEQGDSSGILRSYHLRYLRADGPLYTRIAFTDAAQEDATLRAVVKMCLLVGAAALAVLLGCSYLLAGLAARPVARSLDQQRRFLSDASHELKTPLTAISGYAELIENGMISSDDEIRRMAGEIHNNSGRLITLINDVIRLSELDEEQDEILEKVPLSVVAQSSVKMLQINAEKHHVTLTFEGEDAFIWGTRQMVDEVVYNLCDNAIRYNKENGSVTVRVYRENGRAVLQVQDTGIGIPQECQERIFERFYRVDKGRSKLTGGTGLGLAIVKHILMRLKGELKLVSTPGQGTIITIAFPSCEEDTDR
mgnify:CR=1 FL=1